MNQPDNRPIEPDKPIWGRLYGAFKEVAAWYDRNGPPR